MDEEIMEALYESSFQQHAENLEDTYEDQQVEDFHMVENDERESFVSDLSIEENNMQGSQVSISECDNVQSAISDLHSDCDDQEYLVQNSTVEIIGMQKTKL